MLPFEVNATTLHDMLSIFDDLEDLPCFQHVTPAEIPQPVRRLLVHDGHMTVTLEDYHGAPLRLRVHQQRTDGDVYARKISLHADPAGRPVLAGLMRIHLSACPPAVRAEVAAGTAPLGRVLIAHDVLRRLESGPYFRWNGPGLPLRLPFRRDILPFARLATIHCDDEPTVELLELVTAV
ncbi:MAG: hypothetical protein CHACPFDD_02573 [Phycisphaerae bacterium]|nr:hypothetical protein [Phycisphaerae bacterium]